MRQLALSIGIVALRWRHSWAQAWCSTSACSDSRELPLAQLLRFADPLLQTAEAVWNALGFQFGRAARWRRGLTRSFHQWLPE
ncbi:MAG: hypothetical protein AUH72_07840 [Acidobacteria bacterium 13_1_40CM_4_65_8]|nr:MAG: hypothetical protein AUH72_07840 [Acidobacteria bacterium 13_1_40CM_4_65_8]